ncbi:hypothetical protein CBM2595_A81202 [Cupriavidus taiwanensis]|nr:hypothetical protein CBM2595_A81202 [Cupriavidus taiwanensis]
MHAGKFFCTFFLTSSCKRIMIRLDKSLTSLQRSRKQDGTEKRDARFDAMTKVVAEEHENFDADQARPAS